MVGVLVAFVTTLVAIVVTKTWDPIAEYLGYPFHVHLRVQELADKTTKLQEMEDDFLLLDPQPFSAQRRGWLSRVHVLGLDKVRIQSDYDQCRLNYLRFCFLGVEASIQLKKADGLIEDGEKILQEARAQPHPTCHPNLNQGDGLLGMKTYKKMVLGFIQDKDPRSQMLGIWGMGGVGKSSLLNLNQNYPPHFDHVLYVSPRGSGSDMVTNMQHDIATSITLPIAQRNQVQQQYSIFNNLHDKSFLLLLDNLYAYIDLVKVGIPMPAPIGFPRRKIVFTTRSLAVCKSMGCADDKNTIQISCLDEEDAWSLFVNEVGVNILKDGTIHPLAAKMVQECGGLPLALCTIGKAMSAMTDVREWRSAIDLFNRSKLREITHGTDELFTILKRSYDDMDNTRKKCFLLCSLWPEHENIPREKLIGWWMGLGLVDVSNQGVCYGHSIICSLVKGSMLEKGDAGLYSTETSHVKMHTVLRKMALWIANDRGENERWLPQSFCRSTLPEDKWRSVEKAWILPADTVKWSSEILFPRLIMLVIRHDFSLELTCYFKNITFLDLAGTKRGTFPLEICKLTQLQHLDLSGTPIDALPLKLKDLENLRCLNIRDTRALKTIPQGLILELKRLEELDLFCTGSSFDQVEYLSHLLAELVKSNKHLPRLGFTVQTGEDVQQLGKLTAVSTQALCIHHFKDKNHPDIIDLQFLSGLAELRELTIMNSTQKELLVPGLLPLLEVLQLKSLLQLDKVTIKDEKFYIRRVDICKCEKLTDAIWITHLEHLEQLTIAYCEQMERLFDSAESPSGADFPKLEMVCLEELPKLSKISEKHCKFEELSYVRVTRCQRLNAILVDEDRVNKKKIRIDCNKNWWTTLALEQSQEDIWSTNFASSGVE